MTIKETAGQPVNRRKFLKGGAVAAGTVAAGTVAMPNVSRAQTVAFKFQSTWPTKDIFHEYAADFAAKVNQMASGRLQLELLPAGAVVPAFQLIDAVSTGVLDGGHGVSAYWFGKNKAFSLFGTGPALGMSANEILGWFKYGGGRALYDELINDILKLNVKGYQYGPMPTQPLGWFKKEIKGPDDLKNIKYRTVGLSADMFKGLGTNVTILPGGEIVPAIEKGLIDGAEFNNPSSDKLLGFTDVAKFYMVQSYHQPNESFEILFNKAKYEGLPKELQAIIDGAVEAASADMAWKAMDRYSKDLEAIKGAGVTVVKTPESVLKAQLESWDKVVEAQSADPFFKKVIDSQKAWAKRVVGFTQEYQVDPKIAFQHIFKA
ncbi:MAG: TRAP transporter substrate-binding protein [Hyphomicrobiaceae bacterium]|nr:TRAP transporter substrate-binding protein [Hyphomicrobiaceae bacterium]